MLHAESENIPPTVDAGGVLRLSGTRVALDSVVAAFDLGATPEQTVQSYDTLKRYDVHAVITSHLRHREAVNEHLGKRPAQRARVRMEILAKFPTAGLRERLRARRDREFSRSPGEHGIPGA